MNMPKIFEYCILKTTNLNRFKIDLYVIFDGFLICIKLSRVPLLRGYFLIDLKQIFFIVSSGF